MRNTCVLTFETSLGGERAIRVPDPRSDLTFAHVNAAANQIMPANLFDESVGQLVAFNRAERVVISRIVLL